MLFLRLTGYRTLRYHRVHPLYHLGILNAPWVFMACRMLLFSAHASSCPLDVWFKLQVMIAPQEEALFRFFLTSNHDCIAGSNHTLNTSACVEQGVDERISVKWTLVVDGRARLVTTEVFFVVFFVFLCLRG